jgi:AcrR family transcriptional regulator
MRDPDPAGAPARERLLDAAVALFAQGGFAGTSTRAIASRAGCNLSLIRYYFGSKEGLLLAVVRSKAETVGRELAGLVQEASDPADRLRRFLAFAIGFMDRNQDFLRLVFREVVLTGSPIQGEIAPMVAANIGMVTRILGEARGRLRGTDPRVAALMALGSLMFFFVASPMVARVLGGTQAERVEALRRAAPELLLGGMLAGGAKRRAPVAVSRVASGRRRRA